VVTLRTRFAVLLGGLVVSTLVPRVAVAQPGPSPLSRLEARWGGPWYASTSLTDGSLRFLAAPGIPEVQTEALVADVARLVAVDPDELVLARVASRIQDGRVRELRRFDRFWQGVRVEGDEVLVAVTAGRIGGVWVRLGPIGPLPAPRAGELVLRLPSGHAVLARRFGLPGRIEWRDRSGAIVLVVPTRHDATLTLTHEAYAPGDALETVPAREVLVTDGGGATEVTDDDGATALTGPFDVTLDGPHLTIEQDGAPVRVLGVGDGDLLGGTDLPHEAATVHHHYRVVRDWLAARRGETPEMDEHTSGAIDDLSLPCNAYYDDQTDRFGFSPEVQGCPAMARFGDIVAHEAGHRIHWVLRVGGTYALDVSEGSSDYVSATIHDEPRIAAGVWGPGVPLRNIEPDRVYPRDINFESHNDGLIWASFLWDLRAELSQQLGDLEGVEATDRIFLGALEQGPSLTEAWSAVLVADDDDGDLANGTPHDCTILALLEEHGIGPQSLGALRVEHAPPATVASDALSVPLHFTESTAFPACAAVTTASATLRFTTTPDTALPDAGADDPAWTSIPLVIDGSAYDAEIPRVPANTNVRYFVEVTRADGTVIQTARTLDELWSLWVGDRRTVWCDDFDGEGTGWRSSVGVPYRDDVPPGATNDWEIGAPTGAPGEPTFAHSGARIAGTWLDGDYLPNNAEQFVSPEIALEDRGVMRLATFERWLAVEDGLYDHAGVWVLDAQAAGWAELWSNESTEEGNTALIDRTWTLQQYDLSPVLGADGSRASPLQLAFSLETDQGLEFSGWAIDDVCIVELAEPERHYRVRDLVVSLEGDDPAHPTVALRWSMPWIQPVTGVAIVRTPNAAPTGVADGARLRPPPQAEWLAGNAIEAVDEDPGPGTWHYAVFLAGRGRASEWWDEVVPGENEGSVTIAGEDLPDAGGGDEDAGAPGSDGGSTPDAGTPPAGDGDESGGCGCRAAGASGPGPGLFLLGSIVVGLAHRRRRPSA